MSNTQLAVLAFVAFVVAVFLVKRKLAKKSEPATLVNGSAVSAKGPVDDTKAGE